MSEAPENKPAPEVEDGEVFVDMTVDTEVPEQKRWSFWMDPDGDGKRGLNKFSTAGLTVFAVAVVVCLTALLLNGVVTFKELQESGTALFLFLMTVLGGTVGAIFTKK